MENKKNMRAIAVISLCALFLLLAMGITLMGSGIYKNVVRASDENYTHRTALSYIVNQIRRADTSGAVSIGDFGGIDAVILKEQAEDTEYVTYLYYFNGSIYELYTEYGLGMEPADGTPILPVQTFDIVREGALWNITVTAQSGLPYMTALTLRSRTEENLS